MLSRSPVRPAATATLLAAALSVFTPALSAQSMTRLQPVAQSDRLAAHPDFAPLTQLTHQLPGWVHSASQASARPVDLSAVLHVTVVLNRDPAAQAAFTQLLADQQNPASPLFHRWLTPQQIGELYGPTSNDLATLSSWLTSQGLKVESISPSGVLVSVSGTAALVGNAFHTGFATFDLSSALGDDAPTRTRFSAVCEPTIPTALSPLIRSIHGLAEVPLHPASHATAVHGSLRSNSSTHPLLTLSNGDHFVTPNDFATIFDISSVYNGGNKGATIGSATQRIAVIGESRVAATDISEFETNTGLPGTAVNVVIPPGATDPGTTNTSVQDEATLDVDRVIGTAPGAAVDLIVASSTQTSSGIFTAAQYNVDTLKDPVMTISFGGCELDAGFSGVDFVDTLASSGAAEGITTLVSSGDSGVAGCDTSFVTAPTVQQASINFICSTTFVTCVGGTEFNDTGSPSTYWNSTNTTTYESAKSYIPEGAWNEPSYTTSSNTIAYAPAATGGGVSTIIAKPTWQTGIGVPSGNFRFVPDVSFPAASHDGYYACLAFGGGDCTKGYFEDFSGTSAAAPGMAGVVALINTAAGQSSGNINPLLYSLAASTPAAFHDITVSTSGIPDCTTATPSMCNNSTPGPTALTGGLAGFEVNPGFDEATGLGSLDVANLISAVSSSGGGGGTASFSLSANPATLSATPTASSNGTPITGTVTSTITATSVSSFAGSVALSCSVSAASAPPTCSMSPTSVTLTASGTAASTLTLTFVGSTTTCATSEVHPLPRTGSTLGGIALASLLVLVLPLRKRRSVRSLSLLCLLAMGIASLGGCGGSSSTGTKACSNVILGGTTAGNYTVTITGTQGTSTATTSVALTIN